MMRIQITLVLQCVCNDNLSDYIIMNNRVQLVSVNLLSSPDGAK